MIEHDMNTRVNKVHMNTSTRNKVSMTRNIKVQYMKSTVYENHRKV